jgi:transcriptional regulator with XRE-family HTH domain
VAKRLGGGITPSAISRIRNGLRLPRIQTMEAIARAYNWPLEDQAVARSAGCYAQELEAKLCEAHGSAQASTF